MAEKNEPTAFGEAAHKWIAYGSIFGVGVIVILLSVFGTFNDYVT